MAAERLQKYLARSGVASRRHAEELITAGRVTVNNQKVTELGSKVEPGDLVAVDGTLVSPPEATSYFLLYKPVGVVTTLSDPQGRPTVGSYIEETGKRLFPVGRLDYDAEGALLVTDDGALAHKLTHPSFQVPRTYLAKVKGSPDAATLEKLRGGVRLEDGMATPVSVDVFEQAERNTWLKLVVAEGRPHLIKRLCAAVGAPVVRLYRPSYAGVSVDGLRPGEMRPLGQAQVRQLQEVADGKETPSERGLKLPPRRHGRSAPGFEAGADDDDDVELEAAPVRSPAKKKAARAESTGMRAARALEGAERKERGTRSEGGSRPAFRSATGERAERRTWTPREDAQEEGSGEQTEQAPRGAARGAERREWAPRGEEGGARTTRREAAPRGERAERKPSGERTERKSFGDRPERKSFGEKAERKPFGERAERKPFGDRPERKSFGEKAERKPFGERTERKSFGDRPERKPFGERKSFGEKAERKPFGERPARKSFGEKAERKPFGARGGDEGRAPARAGRPERREWAPREGAAPRGERAERSSSSERPGTERRVVPGRKGFSFGDEPRPARRTAPREGGEQGGEGKRPFVKWGDKKKPGTGAAWEGRPSQGAGGPRGRGPRKGR